jgi:hypothetical protein
VEDLTPVLVRMIRSVLKLLAPLSVLLLVAACGSQAAQATNTEPQRRAAAVGFAHAILDRHDVQLAMRYTTPDQLDLVQMLVNNGRRYKERIVSGPVAGCSAKTQAFPVPSGPCYRFGFRGRPVPDHKNPGFSVVKFGTLYVAVSGSGHPTITGAGFSGGAGEVRTP